MNKMRYLAGILFYISMNLIAQESDPYNILNNYFTAIGGLDKVKGETTSFYEAQLHIAGMEGTIKQWNASPSKSRQEFDLKVFKQVSGDNGIDNWVMDANGKVKLNIDEATQRRREIAARMESLEFLNPESKIFKVEFAGNAKVGDFDCYKVKITNSLNNDVVEDYFSTENYLKLKTSTFADNSETITWYNDYKETEGILKPYKIESEEVNLKQKSTLLISEYKSNIIIEDSLFNPPVVDIKDYKFTNGISAENIPFEYIGEHIFLTIDLNNTSMVWFLDSGADVNVIDVNFAKEIGLKPEGDVKASGVDKVVSASLVQLPKFSLPGLQFNEQTIFAMDMVSLFKQWGYNAVGILGYDFMSRFVTKVDYANKLVSFYDPANFNYKGAGHVVHAPLNDKTFTIPITINNKFNGNWSIDIGAGGCSFHYPYAKENGFLEMNGFTKLSGGAGGTNEVKTININNLTIADFDIKNITIDMPLDEPKGAFASTDIVGNLGNDIFERFVIYFDYASQKMIFEKGTNFDKPKNIDKSGIQLYKNNNNEIAIMFISNNSPAQKAGLKPEDILVKLNDISVDKSTDIFELKELLKGKAGDKIALEIIRNNQHIQFEITLKDLL